MTDFIILAVVALVVGLAGGYIYKEKKAGTKCIGCPNSKHCGGNCSGCGQK